MTRAGGGRAAISEIEQARVAGGMPQGITAGHGPQMPGGHTQSVLPDARPSAEAAGSARPATARPGLGWLLAARFRVPGWLLAGVIYAAGAVAMWWHVWSGHPSSTMTCACGDPSSFVWFLDWPAYAISHGHSLFFSTRVHVPGGMNLLDNTSVLALGVVLAPVTWLFGPIVSLNVALTAAPALTALSAYGTLRGALGVSRLAAFAGGLGFGVSPFMLRNEAVNHLQVTFLALLPLVFWCCYELAVTQRGRWWQWGSALGVLMSAQFFVGLEMFTITVLVTVLSLLLAALAGLWRQGTVTVSQKLPFAGRGFALAAGVAATLLAYPLWFTLAGPESIHGSDWTQVTVNGLAAVLLPGSHMSVGSLPMVGYLGAAGLVQGYLGIPAIMILAVAAVMVRRPLPKLCAAVTAVVVWLSFGPVSGGREPPWLWLPWRVFGRLPVLDKINPANFSAAAAWFVTIAAALLADQLWSRRRLPAPVPAAARGVAAHALAALVAVALVLPWLLAWRLPYTVAAVPTSSWVTGEEARLPAGAVVLFYPFPASYQDQALVWQAEQDMRFAIVGGRGIVAGRRGRADHNLTPGTPAGKMSALTTFYSPHSRLRLPRQPGPAAIHSFRQALRHWGVTDIVMTRGGRAPDYARRWLTTVLGTQPQWEYGAWVWYNVPKLLS